MTTGEKIIKCRKKKNLTQEQLAELLSVSRQSVSKWESDSAFPETSKLKDLSKLFNVTIDYLLNDDDDFVEKEESINSKVAIEETAKSKIVAFFKSRPARVLYYSLVEVVVFLLFFLMPVATAEYTDSFMGYDKTYYVTATIYQFVGSVNYKYGNYIVLLGFLSLFGSFICGVTYSLSKSSVANIIKYVFMSIMIACLIFVFVMCFDSFNVGIIILILLAVGNLVGYIFFFKSLVKTK